MPSSGAVSTMRTGMLSGNALSPSNQTGCKGRHSTSKMCSTSQGQYFWVTTIFIHRSRPLGGTTSTARENKGWSTARATRGRQIAMNALPGTYIPANPHPLKVKSQRTKRLLTAIKNNMQVGGTSTRQCTSIQEQFDSKTSKTRARIKTWKI